MGRGRPRVITTIEDLTQRVTPAMSFRAATFAPAPMGPVGELVLVSNYGEFKKIFGAPINKNLTPGHYQVLSWFRNGGGALYFQRIAELEKDTAVKATLTLMGAGTGTITFTAKTAGPAGNLISVTFYTVEGEQSLAVGLSGFAISVRLGTNAENEIVSTLAQVKGAIEANPAVAELVTVAVTTGSDLAKFTPKTYLTGGASGEVYSDGTSKVIIPIRTRNDSLKFLPALVKETTDFGDGDLSVVSPDSTTNYDAIRTRTPSAGALDIRFLPVLDGLNYSPTEFVIEVYSLSGELLERHSVSTFTGYVDGDGVSKYIGDVLENSEYLEFLLQPSQFPSGLPGSLLHQEPEFAVSNKLVADTYFDAWKSLEYVSDDTVSQDAIDELSKAVHDYWVVFNSLDTKSAIKFTQGVTFTKSRCIAALGSYTGCNSGAAYISKVTGSGETDFGLINARGERSIFAAGHVELYDGDNDKYVKTHGAGALAALICRAWALQGIQYPPSGVRRGGLNVASLPLQFTDAEKDDLFDARINYFETSRAYGPILVGQKTLVNRDCAFDHLNVTAVIMYCNDALERLLTMYIEEPNDDRTRMLARINGEQFLAGMKASGALYDFFVVCDKTNNTDSVIDDNTMIFDYYVKPTRFIDYIKLRATVAPTGVSFDVLL